MPRDDNDLLGHLVYTLAHLIKNLLGTYVKSSGSVEHSSYEVKNITVPIRHETMNGSGCSRLYNGLWYKAVIWQL
jgi:hypothetical protein